MGTHGLPGLPVPDPRLPGLHGVNEWTWNPISGGPQREANPAWPQEALKCPSDHRPDLRREEPGRHRAQNFDLCALLTAAYREGTRRIPPRTGPWPPPGADPVYGGVPASTFYHADSGALPPMPPSVGRSVSYLVSRGEPVSYTSPYSSWQTVLTAEQLEGSRKMGQNVGRPFPSRPSRDSREDGWCSRR
jgi:stage II sporulation protein D